MAMLIRGKSICQLCGKAIEASDRACAFPHFIMNEIDPCFIFSDGAFHESCVLQNRDGPAAIRHAEEFFLKTGPGKRTCAVCNNEIKDHKDYLLIGFLSDDYNNPLRLFNYTHLHKSCIPRWANKDKFVQSAQASLTSGKWRGNYLVSLLKDIKTCG